MDSEDLIYEADPDGRPVVHRRKHDVLERLRRSGALNREMYEAARMFEAALHIAGLGDTGRSWMPDHVSGHCHAAYSERQMDARARVQEAMATLGGMNTVSASVVWHVAGRGISIREWRERWTWTGRAVGNEHRCCGILVGALAVLAARWGLTR